MKNKTQYNSYANRLENLQKKKWKKIVFNLNPYRFHIKKICIGETLEVGCGVGRILEFLNKKAIGVDHNKKAINICNNKGLIAFSTTDFFNNRNNKKYDTLIFSHVLEHMTFNEAKNLINLYLPFLKKNGRLILITPQKKGFNSDSTHIEYIDLNKLVQISKLINIKMKKTYTFPFPSIFGDYFIYNENIFIGQK